MKCKMLFRVGLTLIILVAIILFYLNNVLQENKGKLSDVVQSDMQAFKEAQVLHKGKTLGDLEEHAYGIDGKNGRLEDQKQVEKTHQEVLKKDEHLGQRVGDSAVKVDDGIGKVIRMESDGKIQGNGDKEKQSQQKSTNVLLPLHHRIGKQVNSQVHNIHLAVVACGDRAEEVIVMIKSAVVLTTSTPLILYIFAERDLHTFFTQQFDLWPQEILNRIEYRVYDITFPGGDDADNWKKLFKPCASQRLFLPALLSDVDSVLYVDTDVLFLSPLHKIWAFFAQFNATQLVALAPEHEDPNAGWYNRFARHPFVPPLGVNSGVMLMNLTRLRQSTWMSSIMEYYKQYRLKITWGDQDLINIYFHYHPEELYLYPCPWNYRSDHCMYMSICKPAEQHGAFVLHGSRRVMHNDKQPAFKAVYNAFKAYNYGQDVQYALLENVKKNVQGTASTQCGKVPHVFLKQLEEFVMESEGHVANGLNKVRSGKDPSR